MPKTINEILPRLIESLVIQDDETLERVMNLVCAENIEAFRQQLFDLRGVLGLPDNPEEYQFNEGDDTWFHQKDYDFNLNLLRQKAALSIAMRYIESIRNDIKALEKVTERKYPSKMIELIKTLGSFSTKEREDILKAATAQAQIYLQFHETINHCVSEGLKSLNEIKPKCTASSPGKKRTTELLGIEKSLNESEKTIASNITTLEKAYIARLLNQMIETNDILSKLPTQNKPLAEREKEAQKHRETISQLKENIEKSIVKHNEAARGQFKEAQLLRIEDNDIYKTHIIRQHDTLPAAITAVRNELKIKNAPNAQTSVAASSASYSDNENLATKTYIASYLEPGEKQVTIRDAQSGTIPAIFTQNHQGDITYEADNDALEEISDIVVHDAFRVAQDLLVSTILRHGKDNLEQVRLTLNGSSAKQTQRVHAALLLLIQQSQLKIKPEHILNLNKRAQTPQAGAWSLAGISSTAGNQSRFIQEQLGGKAHQLTTGYSATDKINERIKHANKLLKEELQNTSQKNASNSKPAKVSEGTSFKPGS